MLEITRIDAENFTVKSAGNLYKVNCTGGRWRCSCPARRLCKHLRTLLGVLPQLQLGQPLTLAANEDKTDDPMLQMRHQFDLPRQAGS